MVESLEDILGEQEKETPTPPLEAPKEPEEKNTEELRKQEQKENLDKAIKEANLVLRSLRKETKTIRKELPEEEELPKIDLSDPNSKAWDRHFNEKVDPLSNELVKEKEENRELALEKFLQDKPLLAKNQDKIKKVIETYHSLAEGKITERNPEVILRYLEKAYAAENSEEILAAEKQRRFQEAEGLAEFSQPAVSSGSASYPAQRLKIPKLSEEDRVQIAKWGMTVEEWVKLKQKYS